MIRLLSKLVFTLVVSLFAVSLHAQISFVPDHSLWVTNKTEIAQRALKKKVIIVIDTFTLYEMSDYISSGVYPQKRKEMDKSNHAIINDFKSAWFLDIEVVGKTAPKLKQLKRERDTNYIYFELKKVTDAVSQNSGSDKVTSYYSYFVFFLKDVATRKRIAMLTSRSTDLTYEEYVSRIGLLQLMLLDAAKGVERKHYDDFINRRCARVKTKTLLIPSYLTQLSLEEIKEHYPYPVDIIEEDTMLKIMHSGDTNFVFPFVNHCTGSCGNKFSHTLVQSHDLQPVLQDRRSLVGFTHIAHAGASFYEELDIGDGTISIYYESESSITRIRPHDFIGRKQLENYVKIIREHSGH